jgi:hypothetical protein
MPITGTPKAKADIAQAVAAAPAETGRDLRGIRRDQAMSTKAFNILSTGGPGAYGHALAALRDDTRSYWQECLEDQPTDGLRYEPTAEALKAWLTRHWRDLYDGPIAELEHRDVIRQQALGAAYATPRVEVITRYEVHLDRKLERTLAMLVRLRDLRRSVSPG